VPRTTIADFLADYFRAMVPEVTRRADEARSEHIQTGVWLVGLASALLALFVSNRGKVPFVSPGEAKWMVVLLGVSVVAGVGHRIILLIASAQEYNARVALLGWLRASQMDVDVAQPLDDSWTNEEIVSRLKNHYELDYEFLLKSPSAKEEIRKVYSQVHSSWEKIDRDRLGVLTNQLGKWAGWSDAEVAKHFAEFGGAQGATASAPLIHYRTLFTVGTLALLAGSLAFCAAVIVFCLAFLF
jgi:hypothetical protein